MDRSFHELACTLDAMQATCPTHETCTVLAEGVALAPAQMIRLLRQGVGPCGEKIETCQPAVAEFLRELVAQETARIRELWQAAFGQGGRVQIDFVCVNPAKMKAIREAMSVVDIVPLSFSLQDPVGDGGTVLGDRVRFVIEI